MPIDRRAMPFALALVAAVTATPARPSAHAGPPFLIVSDRVAGPYRVSVWTDPDATDDGTPGGQFWIVLEPIAPSRAIGDDTEVRVAIEPRDRSGSAQSAIAAPDNGNVTRRFAALLMDHEGVFRVNVAIRGPLGAADVSQEVEATYDLRPPPLTLILYLMPFVAVGALWLKMLRRRRKTPADRAEGNEP
jgi:hypothetical protein